tara:strand:- start:5366 stop:6436 length:1071 start_codon:yes stop_codon:yes gene_type:complete
MTKELNINRLRNALNESKYESLVIRSLDNIEWASGFSGSNAWLFIDNTENYLATDSRYATQAEEESKNWHISIGERHGVSNISEIINESPAHNIAILENDISLKEYNQLAKELKPNKTIHVLEEGDDLLIRLRMTKTKDEINKIEQSAQLASDVIEFGVRQIHTGMTEKELVHQIESYAKKQGAQKMSFDTIVASGARAAMPHAKPQNETIMDNSMVLIDLGVYLDGYASDITRTQWIGQSNEKFERIYSLVKLAQEMASERCEAGMSGRDVHAIADTVFNEANISDLFIHGLGHGVGKAIHESPYLDKDSDDILKPGSIITIEPGIYIPGWGGIRIEDMFEVTDTKLRQITTADK